MIAVLVTYAVFGLYVGIMAAPRGTVPEDAIYRGILALFWPLGIVIIVLVLPASAVGFFCRWVRRYCGCSRD